MTNEPLHRLLLRVQSAMNRDVLARASKLGLSPGQPKILEFLLQTGESNQKSIADYCEIEPATAGTILGRMERDGLIARARHEGNRRSLYVTLTPHGREVAQAMDLAFRQADQAAAALLSEEQCAQLCAMLADVCEALNRERKNPT